MTVYRLRGIDQNTFTMHFSYGITTSRFLHLDLPNDSWKFETLGM